MEIENLRNYFAPKYEVVSALPDVKSVVDGTIAVLIDGATQKLYICVKGVWKLIATLA